ncbi:integrin alpha domain-containing protein [Phthorimaea operculella]|nr:integrin alpha domain-containing protein [Phthorimaea operculella]
MLATHWISFALWITLATAEDDHKTFAARTHLLPYHELSREKFPVGKDGALFGYSIAYQKDINSLVVGAPLQNIDGQVYTCPVSVPLNETKCDPVLVDNTDFNKKKDVAKKWDHHAWFGATVNTGRDFFMACAPRILYEEIGMIYSRGQCFYKAEHLNSKEIKAKSMNNLLNSQGIKYYKAAYMTSATTKAGPEKFTSNTFGLSSHVEKDNTIFVGGPAMSIGRTIVYTGETYKGTPSYHDSPKYVPVDNKALNETDKKVSFNFGYSITSGNFSGEHHQIAISTPYGTIGYGRIYFYRPKDGEYEAESDMFVNGYDWTHVGSLFGACLASLRQGNGRSALLVGAPAYALTVGTSPDFTPLQTAFDVGAVFVFKFEYENFDPKTILIKKLLGSRDKLGGRFGASIITVGDFDKDDIDEIAIAAPYEDDGRGAVYMYSGKDMLHGDIDSEVPWLQKLEPKEQPTMNNPSLFGLALTAPADAYENGCNELAIGAPGVSVVTLLHCLASVEVSFQEPKIPDLTKQADTLNTKDNSFDLQQCLEVREFIKPAPSKVQSDVKFSVNVIHPSVRIDGVNFHTVKLNRHGLICKQFKVILPKTGDYDREIKFNVSVELIQNPLTSRRFDPNLVLINKGTAHSAIFPLKYRLPGSKLALKVNTSLVSGYLIGSTESESLTITVSNKGNVAHGVCVRTRLQGVTITDLPKGKNCSFANDELKCSVKTLEYGRDWVVELTLSTKPLTSLLEEIRIDSELLKSNCEMPTDENDHKVITLTRDSNIRIRTYSKPDSNVNATEEELEKGKTIDHVYKITNDGVTTWKNVLCYISLPSQVKIDKIQNEDVRCKPINATYTECIITELRKNMPVNINIHMKIQPGSDLARKIKVAIATVYSELNLVLLNTTRTERITTYLHLWLPPQVPIWMIVVAVLFGLIITGILIWCGCLQRRNKEKLQELKKDIRRQSIRRSMKLRQSTIDVIPNDGTDNGDRKRLISVAEEDTASQHGHLQDGSIEDGGNKDGECQDDGHQDGGHQNGGQQDGDLYDHPQNVRPVKEFHIDSNDPARVAIKAELEKALAKGSKTVVTKADIH